MNHAFRPGDTVIWMKGSGGGFVFPVLATVVAVSPKKVTITANDPDETGAGVVTRHVSPASLQPHEQRSPKRARSRSAVPGVRRPRNVVAPDSFEGRYPHIASWVRDGWIEIGHDDCGRPFLRVMDIGGQVWEGDDKYETLDDAFRAMDEGVAAWLEENG
jgi:hypothetical protein